VFKPGNDARVRFYGYMLRNQYLDHLFTTTKAINLQFFMALFTALCGFYQYLLLLWLFYTFIRFPPFDHGDLLTPINVGPYIFAFTGSWLQKIGKSRKSRLRRIYTSDFRG
jgi:hypothetical protein